MPDKKPQSGANREPDDAEGSESTFSVDPSASEPTITSAQTPQSGDRAARGTPRGEARTGGAELEQPDDRFTLIEILGEGSQGEVCRAFDNHLQRPVAIKFPHRAADQQGAREILDEARKAARLNHANVVTIYECGFWKGRPFISMELVDGESLATVLKQCGRISVDRFLRYAMQILGALEAAHKSGLIHRDLKPHNVLVARDGSLKLTDFGVAHLRGSGREKTIQVQIAGTPGYMAPEQWRGIRPDARSDLYAFGCMAFKLLTGENAFPQEDTMRHHLETPPPSLRDLAPHVPVVLDRMIQRCLAKEPNKRYQSARDLADALELAAHAAHGTSGVEALQPAKEASRRSGAAIYAFLLVLIAGAAAFAWFTTPGRDLLRRLGVLRPAEGPVIPEKSPPLIPPVVTPTPVVDGPVEPVTDSPAGPSTLERARAARDPQARLDLLAQARREFAAEAPELKDIEELETQARKEIVEMTEASARRTLEEAVTELKSLRESERYREAWTKLDEVEAWIEKTPALASRRREVQDLRLGIGTVLAGIEAEQGAFEEAERIFRTAQRVADALRLGPQRTRLEADADFSRRLERSRRALAEQPRFSLLEIDRAIADGVAFQSARFLRGKALMMLGFDASAKADLEAFLGLAVPGPLATEAKTLLALLN